MGSIPDRVAPGDAETPQLPPEGIAGTSGRERDGDTGGASQLPSQKIEEG